MNPGNLISTVIKDYDGLDPTGFEQTLLRERYLTKLQIVSDYICGYRDWEFMYTEDSTLQITVGNNSVAVPTNFADLGAHGCLFDEDRKVTLHERSKLEIEHIRRQTGGMVLNIFAIWNGKIQLPYTATSAINLVLFYLKRNPELSDDAIEMVIPDRYKHRVVLPGFLFHTQTGKNDQRPIWSGMFTEGLAQMCAELNPSKTAGRRMPLAVRRGW